MSKVFATVNISGGVLTLSNKVVKATWFEDSIGRSFNPPEIETWSHTSLRDARENFLNLYKMYKLQ